MHTFLIGIIKGSFLQYKAAAWIGYYQLLQRDIIRYYHIVLKFMNFRVAKMYRNNAKLYGSTKI